MDLFNAQTNEATCKYLEQLSKDEVQDYWLQCIRQWYPELHSQTYFLPPLHFNRVSYDDTTFAGERVLVPKPVQGGLRQMQTRVTGLHTKSSKQYVKEHDIHSTSQTQNERREILTEDSQTQNERMEIINEDSQTQNERSEILTEDSQAQNESTEIQNEDSQAQNETGQILTEDRHAQNEIREILTEDSQTQNERMEIINEDSQAQNKIREILTEDSQTQNERMEILTEDSQAQNERREILTEDIQTQNETRKIINEDSQTQMERREILTEDSQAQNERREILTEDSQTQNERREIINEDSQTQNERLEILTEDSQTQNKRREIINEDSQTQNERREILNEDSQTQNEVREILTEDSQTQNERMEILTEDSQAQNERMEIINEDSQAQNERMEILTEDSQAQNERREILTEDSQTQNETRKIINEDSQAQNERREILTEDSQAQNERREILTEDSQTQNERREIINEDSQTQNVRREILTEDSQTQNKRREIINEDSQTQNVKREILTEDSQTQNKRREIINEDSQTQNERREILTEDSQTQNESTEIQNEDSQAQNATGQILTEDRHAQNERREILTEDSQTQIERREIINEDSQTQNERKEILTEDIQAQNERSEILTEDSQTQNERREILTEDSQIQNESTEILNEDSQTQNETGQILTEDYHAQNERREIQNEDRQMQLKNERRLSEPNLKHNETRQLNNETEQIQNGSNQNVNELSDFSGFSGFSGLQNETKQTQEEISQTQNEEIDKTDDICQQTCEIITKNYDTLILNEICQSQTENTRLQNTDIQTQNVQNKSGQVQEEMCESVHQTGTPCLQQIPLQTLSDKAKAFSLWTQPSDNLDPKPVQESDVRDDRALQRVLHCLRALADNSQPKEVMMVISQLQFGKYLHHPSYAAACDFLPRPCTLPKDLLKHHYDQGDFDVLVISRQHGLITFEIKSVGANFSQLNLTKEQEDDITLKKVGEAVKQLNKAEIVLQHLNSDLRNLKVTKCLVLPNINKWQLGRALKRSTLNGQVRRRYYSPQSSPLPESADMCQCLGVHNVDAAVKRCLLWDELSDEDTPWNITMDVLESLQEWWHLLVPCSGPNPLLKQTEYETLISRFCGPATTVEIYCVTSPRLCLRTLGEAVSETGERMAMLVLFPEQVDLLNLSPPRVFLCGPPGTGKTVVLAIQGMNWFRSGHDIHVVSTWSGSVAMAIIIKHQLQKLKETLTISPNLYLTNFFLYTDTDVETAITHLKSKSKGRQLCVLADEAGPDREFFRNFCDGLILQVPKVFLWSATVSHEMKPVCLQEVKLTIPLRSPPVVVRQLMKADEIKSKEVYEYTISNLPFPGDGPAIIWIKHYGQSRHKGDRPFDCWSCGHEVASVLKNLNVDQPGISNCPPPLRYRDVLFLLDDHPKVISVKNAGEIIPVPSNLVQCLRFHDIPVQLVQRDDKDAIRDMALGISDKVNVTSWEYVLGLERKVIIVENYGLGFSDRLYTMSRCSSQLVLIGDERFQVADYD